MEKGGPELGFEDWRDLARGRGVRMFSQVEDAA